MITSSGSRCLAQMHTLVFSYSHTLLQKCTLWISLLHHFMLKPLRTYSVENEGCL